MELTCEKHAIQSCGREGVVYEELLDDTIPVIGKRTN